MPPSHRLTDGVHLVHMHGMSCACLTSGPTAAVWPFSVHMASQVQTIGPLLVRFYPPGTPGLCC